MSADAMKLQFGLTAFGAGTLRRRQQWTLNCRLCSRSIDPCRVGEARVAPVPDDLRQGGRELRGTERRDTKGLLRHGAGQRVGAHRGVCLGVRDEHGRQHGQLERRSRNEHSSKHH
jgi:hypothetical protein